MSDFSSEFNFENDIDGPGAPGTSVTGTLAESLRVLGVDVGSTPSAADSPAMETLPFVCDRDGCARAFQKQFQLNRHYRWHDKPLVCPKEHEGCAYRAQYSKEIEKHVWSNHVKWAEDTGRKPIRKKCRLCGVTLERPDNVKRHMDEVHKGIKRKRGPGG
ncbi:hypothetical protein J3F83DRAFT_712762 [Trichoderma novae-zelandiae]